MYKAILENIAGIGVLPVVALLLFMAVFVGVIIRVMKMKKSEVDRMANIPLENNETTKNGDFSNG